MSSKSRTVDEETRALDHRIRDAVLDESIAYDVYDGAMSELNEIRRAYRTGRIDTERALDRLHALEANVFE